MLVEAEVGHNQGWFFSYLDIIAKKSCSLGSITQEGLLRDFYAMVNVGLNSVIHSPTHSLPQKYLLSTIVQACASAGDLVVARQCRALHSLFENNRKRNSSY